MTDPHLVEIILERLDQCASQIISPKPDAVFAPAAQVIREMRDEIKRLNKQATDAYRHRTENPKQ